MWRCLTICVLSLRQKKATNNPYGTKCRNQKGGRVCLVKGKYLWTDLFCVDQFAWSGGKGTPALDECPDGLLNGLRSSIHEIG